MNILEKYEVPNIDSLTIKEKLITSLVESKKFLQAKIVIIDLLKEKKNYFLLFQYSSICIHLSKFAEAKTILIETFAYSGENSFEAFRVLSKLAWVEIQIQEFLQAQVHLIKSTEIIKKLGIETSPEML